MNECHRRSELLIQKSSNYRAKNKPWGGRTVPEVPFGADVGADAEVGVEAGLLDELEEADEVVAVGEVVLPLRRLVAVPEDVGLDDVEAAVLGILDQPGPHLRSTRLLRPSGS